MSTYKGVVKFFNTTKGFGFIQPEDGGKDAFVHISAVQRSGLDGLYENDKVSYDLETGRDGKVSATNLPLLDYFGPRLGALWKATAPAVAFLVCAC